MHNDSRRQRARRNKQVTKFRLKKSYGLMNIKDITGNNSTFAHQHGLCKIATSIPTGCEGGEISGCCHLSWRKEKKTCKLLWITNSQFRNDLSVRKVEWPYTTCLRIAQPQLFAWCALISISPKPLSFQNISHVSLRRHENMHCLQMLLTLSFSH